MKIAAPLGVRCGAELEPARDVGLGDVVGGGEDQKDGRDLGNHVAAAADAKWTVVCVGNCSSCDARRKCEA